MIQKLQQMLQMVGGMKNPESAARFLAKKMNNPMVNQLVQMAEQGQNEKVENFVRNVFKEKGINFDEQYSNLKNIQNMFHR